MTVSAVPCGSDVATFLMLFFLPSYLPFSFAYSILRLCLLKGLLLVLFCLLLFVLSYYLVDLPHQGSICELEQMQQRDIHMIRELE